MAPASGRRHGPSLGIVLVQGGSDAELGADDRELLRAERGAVVDVEALGDAAPSDGCSRPDRYATAPSEVVLLEQIP
jgi:hypothetical protein